MRFAGRLETHFDLSGLLIPGTCVIFTVKFDPDFGLSASVTRAGPLLARGGICSCQHQAAEAKGRSATRSTTWRMPMSVWSSPSNATIQITWTPTSDHRNGGLRLGEEDPVLWPIFSLSHKDPSKRCPRSPSRCARIFCE